MKTLQILIFLGAIFFSHKACSQVADSLYVALFRAAHDTLKVQKMLDIAFAQKKSQDSTRFYAQAALDLSRKMAYPRGIGLSLFELSFATNLPSAENYLRQAVEIFTKINDLSLLSDAQRYLADNLKNQGKYDVALKSTAEALQTAQKIKNRKNITICYNTFGIIYRSLGNYEKAVENYYKSLKISEEDKNNNSISIAYNNIGNVYYYQKNYEKAIEYYEKSLEIKKKANDERGLVLTYSNIGECFTQLKNYEKALEYSEKSLILAENIKQKKSILQAYRTLAHAYIAVKKFEQAEEILTKALLLAQNEKEKERELLFLLLYSDLWYEKGEYEKAFQNAGTALELAKKLKNAESLKEAYEKRSLAAEKVNELGEAYFMFKSYIAVRDSLENENNYKAALTKEFAYQSEKQQLEQEKKELAYKSELALLQRDKEIADLTAKDKQRELEILAKHAEAERLEELARAEKDKRKADSLTNLAQKNRLEAENLQIQKEKQDVEFRAESERQQRLQYTYLAFALIFLGIMLMVGYGLYQKQKANKLLSAQNEEIRRQQLEIAEKNDFLNQANEELHQQQEELIVLNENLDNQRANLQKANQNLELLSEIGKEIQRSLDVRKIIKTVHFSVSQLMPVDGFGIGLYNELLQTLDFDGYIEKGEELPFSQDFLNNPHLLSVLCFRSQEQIIINNFQTEYTKFMPEIAIVSGEKDVSSLIYIPLNTDKQNIGVLTVQSFVLNAYREQHIAMLHHIANYTAAALQKADSFREINLQKEELNAQKLMIESTYHQLKHTTEQLDKSIHYASHVQSVVMPEERELRDFFSDLFILFRPRDVVSGDFYWFSQISEHHAVFSLSDCTGHGVPGAFMSMLGATLLHETVNIKKITDDPARILKNVHHAIRKILKQAEKKNNDGMDISLCIFIKKPEEKSVQFIFSGAKSTMSYISNGEIYDLKGDKQYLGGEEMLQDFSNTSLILPENTVFYLYSDGYQDQNNPQRKRLSSKGFKAELLTFTDFPLAEQKIRLEKALDDFQNGAEQRDDISVVGLKI